MIFIIEPELFNYLSFHGKNKFRQNDLITIVQDNISYRLNPSEDSIQYQEKIIELKPFFEVVKKCEDYLREHHTKWYGRSSEPFRLSFWEIKAQACVFYTHMNNEEIPSEIKMCMSYFLDLSNFKFVLGHEVGHYRERLSRKPKIKSNVNYISYSSLVIGFGMMASSLLWSYLISSLQTFLPAFFVFSFCWAGMVFILNYGFYHMLYCDKIRQAHKSEYSADRFSQKLFPECRSGFFKNKSFRTFDSHPSDVARIIALRFGIRIPFPIVFPWNLKFCESYQSHLDNIHYLVTEIKDKIIKKVNTYCGRFFTPKRNSNRLTEAEIQQLKTEQSIARIFRTYTEQKKHRKASKKDEEPI